MALEFERVPQALEVLDRFNEGSEVELKDGVGPDVSQHNMPFRQDFVPLYVSAMLFELR